MNVTAATAAGDAGMPIQTIEQIRCYARNFASLLVQTVVGARDWAPSRKPFSLSTQSDPEWFNIRCEQLGEVAATIKQTELKYPPEVRLLVVDFELFTADGEVLPLESWRLSWCQDEPSPQSGQDSLYQAMRCALSTAMTASRATPMHRYYVKKQRHDSFVILYKLSNDESRADLGEGARRHEFATIPTQCGTFHLSLAYRLKFAIERDVSFVMSPYGDDSSPSAPDRVRLRSSSSEQTLMTAAGTTPASDSKSRLGSQQSLITTFSCSPASPSDEASQSSGTKTRQPSATESNPAEKPKLLSHSVYMAKTLKTTPFAALLHYSYDGTLAPFDPLALTTTTTAAQDSPPVLLPLTELDESTTPTMVAEEKENTEALEDEDERNIEEDEEEDDGDEDDSYVKVASGWLATDDVASGSPRKTPRKSQTFGGFADHHQTRNAFSELTEDDHRHHRDDGPIGNADPDVGALIAACKEAPTDMDSFQNERFDALQKELATFADRQSEFDRFLADVRARARREEDEDE